MVRSSDKKNDSGVILATSGIPFVWRTIPFIRTKFGQPIPSIWIHEPLVGSEVLHFCLECIDDELKVRGSGKNGVCANLPAYPPRRINLSSFVIGSGAACEETS